MLTVDKPTMTRNVQLGYIISDEDGGGYAIQVEKELHVQQHVENKSDRQGQSSKPSLNIISHQVSSSHSFTVFTNDHLRMIRTFFVY